MKQDKFYQEYKKLFHNWEYSPLDIASQIGELVLKYEMSSIELLNIRKQKDCSFDIDNLLLWIIKDVQQEEEPKEWTFERTVNGSYGFIGKLHHKSYKAWINVYKECFYIDGADGRMIPINTKLLNEIERVRGNGSFIHRK